MSQSLLTQDVENTRAEDQVKQAQLVRQIEDLQGKKKQLTEKLNQMMKLNVTRLAAAITDDYIAQFFSQAKQRSLHVDGAGMLLLPQTLSKYDHFDKTLQSKEGFFGDEASETRNIHHELDLIFDAEGRYALYALKAIKNENRALTRKFDVYKTNIDKVLAHFAECYAKQRAAEAQTEEYEKRLRDVINEHNTRSGELDRVTKELGLYKNLEGMTEIKDSELDELERVFWRNLDLIKTEKARRIYQTKISTLETRLGIQSTLPGGSISSKSTSKLLDADEIIESIKTNVYTPELDQQKLDELRNNIIDRFSSGIEQIDLELVELSKAADDSELDLQKRAAELLLRKSSKKKSDDSTHMNTKNQEGYGYSSRMTSQRQSPTNRNKLDIGRSLDDLNFESNAFLTRRSNAPSVTNEIQSEGPEEDDITPLPSREKRNQSIEEETGTNHKIAEMFADSVRFHSLTPDTKFPGGIDDDSHDSLATTNPQTKENSMYIKPSKEDTWHTAGKENAKVSAMKPPINRNLFRAGEENEKVHLTDSKPKMGNFMEAKPTKLSFEQNDFEESFDQPEPKNRSHSTNFGRHAKQTLASLTKSLKMTSAPDSYLENSSYCSESYESSPRECEQTNPPDSEYKKPRASSKDKTSSAHKKSTPTKQDAFMKKSTASVHKRSKTPADSLFGGKSLLKTFTPLRLERRSQKDPFNQSGENFEKSFERFTDSRKEESKGTDSRAPLLEKNRVVEPERRPASALATPKEFISIQKPGEIRPNNRGEAREREGDLSRFGQENEFFNMTNIEHEQETMFTNSIWTNKEEFDGAFAESAKRIQNEFESPGYAQSGDAYYGNTAQEGSINALSGEGKKRRPRAQRIRNPSQQF